VSLKYESYTTISEGGHYLASMPKNELDVLKWWNRSKVEEHIRDTYSNSSINDLVLLAGTSLEYKQNLIYSKIIIKSLSTSVENMDILKLLG
jgi:hypothetical protein